MTDGELCECFAKDILYDASGLQMRYHRSEAARELTRRGRAALPAIKASLETREGVSAALDEDLRYAWGMLLHDILGRTPKALSYAGLLAFAEVFGSE